MKQAYGDDPPALRNVPNVTSLSEQIPLRKTSKLLKLDPPGQTQIAQQASPQQADQGLVAAALFLEMMKAQSKQMDLSALLKPGCTLTIPSPLKEGLGSNSASQAKLPLDNGNQQPLVPLPTKEGQGGEHQDKADVPPLEGCNSAKSLEDFEADAFKKLGGNSKKRPASAMPKKKAKASEKAKPKPKPNKPATKAQAPKTKAKAKAKGPVEKEGAKPWYHDKILGCIRCRGNFKGCSECQKQDFRGLRLPGRAAWQAYMQKRKRDGN